jgi:hypothetical protein
MQYPAPATVLDDIFDPAKGWPFSPAQVPLQRSTAHDGNPYYIATVDGIPLEVFEQNRWKEGVSRKAPPGRLVVYTSFTGVEITNPKALLIGAFDARGLPSVGLNPQGRPTLQAAFPYAPEIPLEIARKQLMVCMGLVAEQAAELLRAWNQKSGPDLGTVETIASIAGAFLSAFTESGARRLDPESGVVQEKGILGWKDTDERFDPETGKHQVRGIFGWKDK